MKRSTMVAVLSLAVLVAMVGSTAQGGLVAYWPFDGNLDNSPNNYPSTGNNTTFSTTVPWTMGGGNSVNFNGSNAYVSVNSGTASVVNSYTVSVWARVADNAGRNMFSTRAGGGNDASFDMKFQNGNMVHGDIGSGTGWYNTNADLGFNYSTNRWYHVTYAVSPNAYRIYVHDASGSLLAANTTGTFTGANPLLFDANHPIGIGRYVGGEYFNGQMDEVRVHDTALTQQEVQALAIGGPVTGKTGPGGFERTDIPSSLLYWLRADKDVQQSGGVVSAWNDQTNRANNFSQGGAGQQPSLVAGALGNNLPAVRFDGSNDRLTLGTATTPSTVFAVTKVDPYVWLGGIWGTDNPSDKGIRIDTNTDYRGPGHNQDGNDFPNSGTAGNIRVNGQVTTTYAVGTPHILTEVRGSGFSGADTFNVTQIGGYYGGRNYGGDVGDVIVYDRVLNSAERQIVENSLSAKYDIALGGGNVYDGDDPINGNYDLDVFGIGRIDAANQVMNAGAAGLGLMASGGTLDDNEWLLASHRVPDNVFEGTWKRVWRIDKTGNLDALLTFDFSDAGLSPPPGLDQVPALLFYSSGPGLNFTALPLTGLVSDDRVSFLVPNALLEDGYYTLSLVPEPTSLALLGLGLLALARRRTR